MHEADFGIMPQTGARGIEEVEAGGRGYYDLVLAVPVEVCHSELLGTESARFE
jgi:hypothetical protein